MRRFVLSLIVGSVGAIAIGCTSTVTLRNDELHRLINQPRIQAAVLATGDRIQFDELGAELDPRRQTVKGITVNGDSVELPYSNVYYLRVASRDSSGGAVRDLGPKTLEPEFMPRERGPVTEAVLLHGDTVLYNHEGATVDFRLKTLSGRSHFGRMASCSLADVESVRLKARFYAAKTMLLAGGITIVAILYAYSQMDFTPTGQTD